MQRSVMRAKIHRATVTRADMEYEGSCGIDADLMRAADIVAGEQVHIVNLANGSRAVTYVIEGAPGEVSLNGAMAHLGAPGDTVIIIAYGLADDEELRGFTPRVVHVDAHNRVRLEAGVS